MAVNKSQQEYLKSVLEAKVIDMKNPMCLNCNECCTLTASITHEEYLVLNAFIQTKEGNKIHREGVELIKSYMRKGTIYLMCPFSDPKTKRCKIYTKRPQICRDFHCSKSQPPTNPNSYTIYNLFFED